MVASAPAAAFSPSAAIKTGVVGAAMVVHVVGADVRAGEAG